ncbi:MAG: M48 family metallopeptidase [Pseudomonadota bacterium]
MTVIRVGSAHEEFEGRGLYFDGETAQPLKARLRIDEAHRVLGIFVGEDDPVIWPLDDIRQVRDQAGGDMMVLRLRDNPVTRLVLTATEEREIARIRAVFLRKAPPVEGKMRLLTWGGGALGAVALMIFALIPFLADNLAGLLPPAGKRALGETVFEDIREALDQTGLNPTPICEAPEGMAALEAMGARLFPEAATEEELLVYVLDHDMVNAFALPGGIVVFMRGLIDEAENADEVAAVYAHEVGHVVARDPSRIALRTAGSTGVLGLLLGDFAGGAVVLFLTNRLIQADYTQEAEAAADSYAHGVLNEAGVRPDAIGTFFERLRDEHGDTEGLVQHFMSHPAMGDRIQAARDAVDAGASYTPVLGKEEWLALRGICGTSPNSKK